MRHKPRARAEDNQQRGDPVVLHNTGLHSDVILAIPELA
jgi:hypothetical protein